MRRGAAYESDKIETRNSPRIRRYNRYLRLRRDFKTRSTKKGDLHVEICSACHPFFTGNKSWSIPPGRVDRFNKRYGKKQPPSPRIHTALANYKFQPCRRSQ
jgi:large subunit ribosomal protein L31